MRHAHRLACIKLISRGDLRLACSIGRLDVAGAHQCVGITDVRLVHGQCGRVLVEVSRGAVAGLPRWKPAPKAAPVTAATARFTGSNG